jgi:hypothetical protein
MLRIILLMVGWVTNSFSEALASLLLAERLFVAAQHVVVGHGLVFEQYGVARREIEDHHVVAFDPAQSLEPVVGPLDRLGKRFFRLRKGHRVVYERERQRRVGHLRAVGHLAHVEVVADQQRRDQRARGDVEGLEQQGADDERDEKRLDDHLDRLEDAAFFLGRLALAFDFVGHAGAPGAMFIEEEPVSRHHVHHTPYISLHRAVLFIVYYRQCALVHLNIVAGDDAAGVLDHRLFPEWCPQDGASYG